VNSFFLAKDLAHPIYHHRARRTSLHLDPRSFERKPYNVLQTESSASSPSSSTNLSPITPREDSVPLTPDGDFDATREPMFGPQRTGKSRSDRDADRDKRKRSRVTPEQLVHLERFFSIDRSPTAVRRKEISELLGMQERQTQIWFQNRSAASFMTVS
jgi:regulatory protein PHO2